MENENEKKIIEIVCSGNNGRSPLGSAIAQQYIVDQGLDNEYEARSSGTSVDSILAGTYATKLKKVVLEKGYEHGASVDSDLVKEIEKSDVESIDKKCAEDSNFQTHFEEDVETARLYLANEEEGHCYHEAERRGAEQYLDGNFKQTKPNSATIAYLTMGESNKVAVEKMHKDQEQKPIIAVISKYANGENAEDVPNAFAQGPEVYERVAETLDKIVPAAVDKVVAQYVNN